MTRAVLSSLRDAKQSGDYCSSRLSV